ncbi:MAG: ASCH domain-containing protein [Mesorhizobium sp.]|uniref:ASCH domain-containing protein n=1 Tax=Mesorhizobium sp. TaxID=1871066 RepID=UPI000FE690A1|nr:ASCH domain-containing protein [Mesorhizobium sp.]RWE59781.1 MAG: ASCH domain-containing protein [Mesorhizobium sp.]TIX98773.1 MAG: ASCH domain-containing protein [Mesorhizobium sp.]
MSGTLTLPLKAEYFDSIRDGAKTEEFRLVTDFWRRRLEGKAFDKIVLTKGYPRLTDHDRRIARPWRGYTVKTITHKHFGPDPVEVFAILVNDEPRP